VTAWMIFASFVLNRRFSCFSTQMIYRIRTHTGVDD
jgi:hypothetical protein